MRFHRQALLEALLYAALSVLLFVFCLTGTYLNYVTPRMGKYLIFASVVLLFFAVERLRAVPGKALRFHYIPSLTILLPCLILVLPHKAISPDVSLAMYKKQQFHRSRTPADQPSLPSGQVDPSMEDPNAPWGQDPMTEDTGSANNGPGPVSMPAKNDPMQGSSASSSSGGSPAGTLPSSAVPETTADATPKPQSPEEDRTTPWLTGIDKTKKTIVVKDDEFYAWITELFQHTEDYIGYTVELTGFVMKDPQIMSPTEFIPARNLMTCCVADLVPTGIICEYPKAAELKPETWVHVKGTLIQGTYDGSPEAQLKVISITPATAPKNPYIYPY